MRPALAFLILFTSAALAQAPAREAFPSDYTPSACAPTSVCKSFNQSQFAEVAALRGYDIGQEWVDAHWKELTEALRPSCTKVATCFATAGNHFTFCNDILQDEVYRVCERYEPGSTDRTKCDFFIRTWWAGADRRSREPWEAAQACAATQASAERTLLTWMVPEKIDASYKGTFIIHALDSETRVPVQARVHVQSKEPIYAEDATDGLPTTSLRVPWQPKLTRIPNANGHRDVAPPEVRVEAAGYRTVTFRLPVDVPTMKVEMTPPPKKLKKGRNTVTIVARDAATGELVEARVMGGYAVLGKTNEPFELELTKGQKRPEIWVTSLYDRYSDVVVAPAGK